MKKVYTPEEMTELMVFSDDSYGKGYSDFSYALSEVFSDEQVDSIIARFAEFIDSLVERGEYNIDSKRIRVLSKPDYPKDITNCYDNKDAYNTLVTCCGSEDVVVFVDNVGWLEIGCNFGH